MMIPTVSLVLMMSQLISSQAVFSSTEQMGKILKLEKQLVEEMTRHSEELETALNSIEEYVSQVTEVAIIDCKILWVVVLSSSCRSTAAPAQRVSVRRR